jgi:uncharacterized protein (DUF58 family)
LLLLCLSSVALPGLSVTLPLLALLVALAANYVFAYRHLSCATIALSVPPLGRVGEVMVWTTTTAHNERSFGGWLLVGASRRNRVPLVPGRPASLPVVLDQRGVFTVAQLHLISVGPLFLPLHATRQVLRPLSSPLVVAPQLHPIPNVHAAITTTHLSAEGEISRGGDVPGGPESLRPFERGDRISAVHWPATARTGVIHVKQLEQLGGSRTVTVVVDNIDGSKRGEAILSEATWLVHQLVAGGYRVDLATARSRVYVTSAIHADEVLSAVEPGVFVGDTGTRDNPWVGTVSVVNGHWIVNGVAVLPAGQAVSPVASDGNPPAAVVLTGPPSPPRHPGTQTGDQ